MPAPAPSTKPIPQKLGFKPGFNVLVTNAPDSLSAQFCPLPDGATIATAGTGPFDAVVLFVRTRAEADSFGPAAIGAVKAGGLLWIAYPKKSGRGETEVSRDRGWDAVNALAWRVVSLVALDGEWTALRFRSADEISRSK